MKKIFISLLIIIVILTGSKLDVYAKTYTDKFIISEEIEGISYAKVKNGKTEYRKAKFKRRISDNKIVYCIEPFVDMIENSNYKGYDYNYNELLNISIEDWTRINLLSYYGYGYKNHTDSKWYPITQILIWKTIDKNATFYWTKTFKGEEITRFTSEINELEKLVENHSIKPSFDKEIINESIGKEIIIEDKNNVLNNFKIVENNDKIKITNNKLIINAQQQEKEINISFEKKDDIYNINPIIYISDTYQNVLSVGSYIPIKSSLTINIGSGKLKIKKLDEETKSTLPQGEAELVGTKFNLYHENQLLKELIIDEESTALIENLPYGEYKLIESQNGLGYTLNPNVYTFTIDENNREINLEICNKVIKRKIKIYKFIEDDDLLEKESNIKFEIYDNAGQLVKQLITDENGEVEFELPYGTYLVKQQNTTDGYKIVEDFQIEIKDESNEILEYFLYDIKVPNTSQNDNTITYFVLLFVLLLIVGIKKRYEKNS